MWWIYVTGAIMLVLSYFYSSAEVVYTSVNLLRLKKKVETTGKRRAKLAYKLATNFSQTVATNLFGNALTNIAVSSLAVLIGLNYPPNGETIASISVFVILLIFCEIAPKTISLRYSYRLSLAYAYIMQFFVIIFYPFVMLVRLLVDGLSKLWNRKPKKKKEEEDTTDEELAVMVSEIEESGAIDARKGDLLHSAITFTDTQAYECMTPRVDVFAFDIDDDINEVIANREIFQFSRIPVYEDSIDNIIGILPTKNFLKAILVQQKVTADDIRRIMVKPMYVHRSKLISDVLADFKREKRHIAIVKDEYGGTEGIITMEDIIEELVGDIWDESDTPDEEIEKIDDDTYFVSGMLNIDDFFDLIDYDEDVDTDYATVGGFCLEMLDRFAKVGDAFTFGGYLITVVAADEFSVEKVKIHKLANDEDDDERDEPIDRNDEIID